MLRTLLVLATLLVASTPAAASARECTPIHDGAAVEVGAASSARYYEKLHRSGGFHIQELWQDANGEPGLQSSAGMSCGGVADRLVSRVCLGLCPIEL